MKNNSSKSPKIMLLNIKQYPIFKSLFLSFYMTQKYLLCCYCHSASQHHAYLPKLSHYCWSDLLLGEESSGKQDNWSDILMKHFLGSTQTRVNHSFNICLFHWGGLIRTNPFEFKCLDLNLLRKKQNGSLKNKLYGRRVRSIDLPHQKKKKNQEGKHKEILECNQNMYFYYYRYFLLFPRQSVYQTEVH